MGYLYRPKLKNQEGETQARESSIIWVQVLRQWSAGA